MKTTMMKQVGFLLLFITTGLCSEKWFRINSTCFHVDERDVTQSGAIKLCRERGAILHSVQNEAEFKALVIEMLGRRINWVWVSAKRTTSGFKWSDGRDCCPKSWWWPGEPGAGDEFAVLRTRNSNPVLIGGLRTDIYPSLCSKPVVGKWTLVKCEEYYWPDLCGVAIMPNCDGRSCEEICNSTPDCKQFAKIANLCINIKNDAPLNECVIKMRHDVKLYEWKIYCK